MPAGLLPNCVEFTPGPTCLQIGLTCQCGSMENPRVVTQSQPYCSLQETTPVESAQDKQGRATSRLHGHSEGGSPSCRNWRAVLAVYGVVWGGVGGGWGECVYA